MSLACLPVELGECLMFVPSAIAIHFHRLCGKVILFAFWNHPIKSKSKRIIPLKILIHHNRKQMNSKVVFLFWNQIYCFGPNHTTIHFTCCFTSTHRFHSFWMKHSTVSFMRFLVTYWYSAMRSAVHIESIDWQTQITENCYESNR